MINFKREYIGLEQDRLLYPVSFTDKAKCNVYGRKKFITEAGEEQLSAHAFLISKDFWTFNAGQLDFTNYANGIWNDYISIVVVERGEYTAPSINFASMGDITPENLQELSEYTTKHLSDLEKRIVEDYLFIDEGTAENIGLPNLPENHFWVRKNGVIVGVNLDYLKIDYDYLKNNMEADFNTVSKKVYNVFKNNVDSYIVDKNDELQGATYTPTVSPEGIITFTNDKNKPNPEPVNIKGPAGTIENVTASVDSNAGTPNVIVTPTGTPDKRGFNFDFKNLKGDKPIKGTDYYTNAEKEQFTAETKAAVQAEGAKVIEEVKKLVGVNPAGGDAVSVGGKTRAEFDRDIEKFTTNVYNRIESDIKTEVNKILEFPILKGNILRVKNGNSAIDVYIQNTPNHMDEPLQRLGYMEPNTTAEFTCNFDARYLRVWGTGDSYVEVENISLEVPIMRSNLDTLDKMKYYVTPQMFGAKADGINDDKDAINKALQSSKVVKLPIGKYRVSGTVTIPKNTSLIGCGKDSIIAITSESTVPVVAFDESAHDSSVENLVVQGVYDENKKGKHGIFVAPYNADKAGQFDSHNRISNVRIYDSSGCGIYVGASQRGCTFENIIIQRSVLNGFEIWGSDNLARNLDVSVSGKHSFMCDWGSWNNRFYECKGYHAGLNNTLGKVLNKNSDLMFVRANFCHVHLDLQECVWGALKVQGNGNKLDLMIDGLGKKAGQKPEWDNANTTAITITEASSSNSIKASIMDGTLDGKLTNLLSLSDKSFLNTFDIYTNNINLNVLKESCHFNNSVKVNGMEYESIKYSLQDVSNTFGDIKALGIGNSYNIECNISDLDTFKSKLNKKFYFQMNMDSNLKENNSIKHKVSLVLNNKTLEYETAKKGIVYSTFDLNGVNISDITSAKIIVSVVKKEEISIETPSNTILTVNDIEYGFGERTYKKDIEINDEQVEKNRLDISTLKEETTTIKSELNTKISKNQGIENNGKVLGIDERGNVAPIENDKICRIETYDTYSNAILPGDPYISNVFTINNERKTKYIGLTKDLDAPKASIIHYIIDGEEYALRKYKGKTSMTDYMKTKYPDTYKTVTNITDDMIEDTSDCVNLASFFAGCNNVISIPKLYTKNSTSFYSMYRGCYNLLNPHQIDTSKGKDFSWMYEECRSVVEFPQIDTSKGETFKSMYNGCTKATKVSDIDLSSITAEKINELDSMLNGCTSLKSVTFNNVPPTISEEQIRAVTKAPSSCQIIINNRAE